MTSKKMLVERGNAFSKIYMCIKFLRSVLKFDICVLRNNSANINLGCITTCIISVVIGKNLQTKVERAR